jgi:hypothetical protein
MVENLMTGHEPAPDWPFIEDDDRGIFGGMLMSNSDREVNDRVAERMKTEEVLAEYTGWNFHAACWYRDGQYHAEVCVHHVHRATISGPTPQDVMREVSDIFGWD